MSFFMESTITTAEVSGGHSRARFMSTRRVRKRRTIARTVSYELPSGFSSLKSGFETCSPRSLSAQSLGVVRSAST